MESRRSVTITFTEDEARFLSDLLMDKVEWDLVGEPSFIETLYSALLSTCN